MNLIFEDQPSETPFIHKYKNQCKGHVRNATLYSEYVLPHTHLVTRVRNSHIIRRGHRT
jgi:hypothetical protein